MCASPVHMNVSLMDALHHWQPGLPSVCFGFYEASSALFNLIGSPLLGWAITVHTDCLLFVLKSQERRNKWEKSAGPKEQLTLILVQESDESRWKAWGLNKGKNNRERQRWFKQPKSLQTEQFILGITWPPLLNAVKILGIPHELWFNRCFRNQDCVSHHFLIFTSHVQSQEINLTRISEFFTSSGCVWICNRSV